MIYWFGVLATVCLTFLLVSGTYVPLLALLGVGWVAIFPVVGLAGAIVRDGVGWPVVAAGLNHGLISNAMGAAVLAGCVVQVVRGGRLHGGLLKFVGSILILTLPGLVVGSFLLSTESVLAGLALLLVPLGALLSSSITSPVQARWLMKMVALLMFVALCFAVYQSTVGQVQLLASGVFQEGVNVRGIGGMLRASGSFLTNYHFGAFAAVFGFMAFFWWPVLEGAAKDRIWIFVGGSSAVIGLALSTYRTGVVLMVVAIASFVALGGLAVRVWVRVTAIILGSGVVIWFFSAGLADSRSLDERFRIWSALLEQIQFPFGNGIGYSGAASGAGDGFDRVVVDNYYLSLVLQFGLPGCLIVIALLAGGALLVKAGRQGNNRVLLAGCLALGILATFALVDFWEYSSAICLAMFAVGHSLSEPSGVSNDRTGRPVQHTTMAAVRSS